jgi:hypothetical protein
MKIAKHISFYFISDRIIYINKIIAETNKYLHSTDIFIHTNNKLLFPEDFDNYTNYTNGKIKIIYHDLSGIDPHYLTWKCRDLLKQQRYDYDIFMYIEDDILVPYKAVKYWEERNEKLIKDNYNLGFVRIEVGNDGDEYITDLPGKQFTNCTFLDSEMYCINDITPYCAFWIYNKHEFNKFVDSKWYDLHNIIYYSNCIREKSAFGLHLFTTDWYKKTVIPIVDNKLSSDCKIYHITNNYVNDSSNHYATVKFLEALNLN